MERRGRGERERDTHTHRETETVTERVRDRDRQTDTEIVMITKRIVRHPNRSTELRTADSTLSCFWG